MALESNGRLRYRAMRPDRLRVNLCIGLLYWLTFADWVSKFLPLFVVLVCRYLPEALVYGLAIDTWWRHRKSPGTGFAPARPLLLFAAAAVATTLLNHSVTLATLSDLRTFFRFLPLAYVLFRCRGSSAQTGRVVTHIYTIAALQAAVGAAEMALGDAARDFFIPFKHPLIADDKDVTLEMEGFGWASGTLSNYNHFGIFMAMVAVLSLALYLQRSSSRARIMFAVCGLATILSFSRHSLLCLGIGCIAVLSPVRNRLAFISIPISILLGGQALMWLVRTEAVQSVATHSPSTALERFATLGSEEVLEGDRRGNVRLYLLQTIPQTVLSTAPLFGFGPASIAVPTELQSLRPDIRWNPSLLPEISLADLAFVGDVVWLLVLCHYGCVGLGAFLWIFASVMRRAFDGAAFSRTTSQSRVLCRVCLAWTLMVIAAGFFSLEVVARDTIPLYWLVVGLTLNACQEILPQRKVLVPISRVAGRERSGADGSDLAPSNGTPAQAPA